ncbi:MAG: hypothetical protein KDB23_19000 [Planctomycetales bacterium]|nr:hypothetical protein [Planctomycetales bacterium]
MNLSQRIALALIACGIASLASSVSFATTPAQQLTVSNKSKYAVVVHIGGYGVNPQSKCLQPNETWRPAVTATASSVLIDASVGSFTRSARRRFGTTTNIVNDRPPVRPIKVE